MKNAISEAPLVFAENLLGRVRRMAYAASYGDTQ